MFEEQGLVLYFIGLRLEESILIANKAITCLTLNSCTEVEYELMEAILRNSESFNTYKFSYRSSLNIQKVIELLLLDSKYPKSLANKLEKLLLHADKLPRSLSDKGLSEYQKYIFEATSLIKLKDPVKLSEFDSEISLRKHLRDAMNNIISFMMNASDAISKTFFTHSYHSRQREFK